MTSMSGKPLPSSSSRMSSMSGVSTMLGQTALMVMLVLGQLGDERADQADHGVLGQAVDGVGREADEPGQRGGGHDGAAAPGGQGAGPGPAHRRPPRPR